MGFYIPEGEDSKQHLNLSTYAWNCIYDDMQCFDEAEDKPNLAGFLNRVFLNFYEVAKASLASALIKKREEYYSLLDSQFPDMTLKQRNRLVDALLEGYKTELLSNSQLKEKGEYRKIRLNKRVKQILSEKCEENNYYDSPGMYLKALYEEYARLPFCQREKVYYREHIRLIKEAIDLKKKLKLMVNHTQYKVIPYMVTTDKSSMYHYLVGISKRTLENGEELEEYRTASYRLSRIKELKLIRTQNEALTKEQLTRLEEAIREKGVQFLVGDATEIRLKLTPEGIKKYNLQLNLRPAYECIEGTDTYLFRCTEAQILFYFFKFGRDVTVLSPQSLRESFCRLYREALTNYCEEQE